MGGKGGGEIIPLRKRKGRPFRILLQISFLVGIVLMVLGGILWYYPVMTVEVITIVGNDRLEEGDIIRLVGVERGDNLFALSPRRLEGWLGNSPWLKNASVVRVFPEELTITLEERVPAFQVPYYTSFVMISGDGVILGPVQRPDDGEMLPVLTGLELSDPLKLGEKIEDKGLDTLLAVWDHIPPKFLEEVVEFHLEEDGELVMYTETGIQILFGQASNIPAKFALIETARQEKSGRIESINVRGGTRAHVRLVGSTAEGEKKEI